MGHQTVDALIEHGMLAGFSHSEAHVLIVLANYEGDEGAFPGERTLAAKAHANRRTVRAALAHALDAGLIRADGTKGRGVVVYRFTGAASMHQSTGAARTHQSDGATGAPLVHSEHATGAFSLARNSGTLKPKNRAAPARLRDAAPVDTADFDAVTGTYWTDIAPQWREGSPEYHDWLQRTGQQEAA